MVFFFRVLLCLVLLVDCFVLLSLESATDEDGMKSFPLLCAGTVLNLMVGMCWIVCLVG